MLREILSRIKLDFSIIIIIAFVFANEELNEKLIDSRTNFADGRKKLQKNNDEKKINIGELKKRFSNSADLKNYLPKSNIFELDANTIKDYLKIVRKDIDYFIKEMCAAEKEIKETTDFIFFQRICKNAISLFFNDQKSRFKSLELMENVLSFIDDMSNIFYEEKRSEDEIADFESFTADTNKTIAEYKKNLKKQVEIYNFCKHLIFYKTVEQIILNCYLICYYSKIAFSYGFCGMDSLNGLSSHSSVSKKLLNALLKDVNLSSIHEIKNEIIPRLRKEHPGRNAAMVKKVNNLLKEKCKNGVISDEIEEFEGKSLQELIDIQKELESELMTYEDDFEKIENKKNEDFEEYIDYEKRNTEFFNKLVLEFYKPRANTLKFFTCPKQSVDLEKNLLKDIRKITNNLLDFYYKLEQEFRSYYKKLEVFVNESNSIKNKIRTIQSIIDRIYQEANAI